MTERALDHVAQFDHWTFLVALCLAAVDAARERRPLPVLVTGFLTASLLYDAYEFLAEEGG